MMWVWMAIAAFAADTRYVQATSLNLRETPAPDARSVWTLPINSPVEVLSVRGKLARVRFEEREGWVAVEFLSGLVLTVEAAMARAASEPAERHTWLQRAEAIRSIEAQRKWPSGLFLVWGGCKSTWIPIHSEGAPDYLPDAPLDDEAFRQQFGFDPRAAGWVLPDAGPAVKGKLAGARVVTMGGFETWRKTIVDLVVDLPPERAPLAFFRGDEPPAGWRAAAPAPPVPESRARQVAAELLAGSPEIARSETLLWPTPIGWLVSVRKDVPAGPGTRSVLVTADGTREVGKAWPFDEWPIVARDLTGDGEIELVSDTDARRTVRTVDGHQVTSMAREEPICE